MKRIDVLGEATEAVLAWSLGGQYFRVPRGAYVALVLVIMLGALTVLAASPAHATTVKGTFQYKDKNLVTGMETDRPITNAQVEIWRFRSRCFLCPWTWGRDKTVWTDKEDGSISVDMPFAGNGVVYGVRVFATNDAAIVWPNDAVHTLPFHREPGEDDGQIMHLTEHSASDVLDFSYTFHGWSSQHFNIAEVARQGKLYADTRRAPGETDTIPKANFQPSSATFGENSYYNALLDIDTVVINSKDVDNDRVILHEYAHYLEEMISSLATVPTTHYGCDATNWVGTPSNTPDIAWREGFADYFSQVVQTSLPPGTITGAPQTKDYEQADSSCPGLPDSTHPGDGVENFVAGTLWDVYDQPSDPGSLNEAHDTLARSDTEIFQIFDHELDVYGVWPTITHFRHAWMAREDDPQTPEKNEDLPEIELSRIMVQHHIPLRENYGPTANAGADQTVEEGKAVTLDGSRSSDPDLNSLNFTWTQVSGPAVTLANPSSATPSFTAPRLSSQSATLVFRLVVSDGSAPPSVPDEVAVQVLDTGALEETKAPREAIVSAGTLRAGTVGRLSADDNAYYQVNSTTSATRRTSWFGRFADVSNDLGNLRITYKGKNSASCSQTVDVFRWTDSTWVPLSQRSVGTTEVNLADLAPSGAASDYVSGDSGLGEVRVRVSCTRSSSSFYSSADLMRIAYQLP
jgi:hypothetical protein